MSGKPLQYWREQWEAITDDNFPGDVEDMNVGRTLAILAMYSHVFKKLPIPLLNVPTAWGGEIGRLFTGRWNSHHGREVQDAP